MADVNMVGTPAGYHPGSKLFTTKPSWAIVQVGLGMNPVQGVIFIGRGTQPHIIIEVFGNRHFGCISSRRIPWQAYLNAVKFANSAVPHQFTGSFELGPGRNRSLLTANLENNSRTMYGV